MDGIFFFFLFVTGFRARNLKAIKSALAKFQIPLRYLSQWIDENSQAWWTTVHFTRETEKQCARNFWVKYTNYDQIITK